MFNRRLQELVFDVQRAYYRLDAARGLEQVAERNLQLAHSVLAAADQRLAVGLATKPEALLARQVEAQARYDVENAIVAVKNGEADLAVTLGVRADRPLRIEPLAAQTPTELDGAVESVIADALRDRPDLAARAADLRAAEAQVAKARADFLPTLGFRGAYGQQIWNYQAADKSNLRANEPSYDTLFTFDWPLFTGFERRNALLAAEHATAAARAELAAREVDAIAEVWRSLPRLPRRGAQGGVRRGAADGVAGRLRQHPARPTRSGSATSSSCSPPTATSPRLATRWCCRAPRCSPRPRGWRSTRGP